MTNEINSSVKNNIVGALFVLLTTLCFSSSVTTGKYISTDVATHHIIFWKSIIGIPMILILALAKKKTNVVFRKMSGKQLGWTIFRAIVGTTLVFTLFLSSRYGNVSELGSIINLNPVVTVFLAFFILKEDLNLRVIFAVIVAITGVIFIVGNPFKVGFSFAYVLIFLTMFMVSFETISIRRMNMLGIDVAIIAGSAMLLSLIVSLPMVIKDGFHYSGSTMLFLLMISILDLIGHLSISTAGKYLPARKMSIFGLISVFEYMIFGVVLFDEKITIYKVIGALLIITASTVSIIVRSPKRI